MLFIALNSIAGILLIFLSVFLAKKYRTLWKMPKWMFLKVGLLALVIQVFAFSVFDSLLGYFPSITTSDILWQALATGFFAGLFFELGRFYILDKIYYRVRNFRQGVYFAFGWSGVSMFLVGSALIFSSIGLYMLNTTADVSQVIPDATPEQISQLEELKNLTEGSAAESVAAIVPLFENVAYLLLDIVLTLIIVLGLMQKSPSFVWIAVSIRAVVSVLRVLIAGQSAPVIMLVLVAVGIGSYLGIKRLKPSFSA